MIVSHLLLKTKSFKIAKHIYQNKRT